MGNRRFHGTSHLGRCNIDDRVPPGPASLSAESAAIVAEAKAQIDEYHKAQALAAAIDAQCQRIRDALNEIADMTPEQERELNERILRGEGECPHLHVTVYWRLYARATRFEPAEYIGRAECDDCGEWIEPEDVPAEAERVETVY